MPTITFAPAVQRQVDCPTERIEGATLDEIFEIYFAVHPQVRGYVLDEQGAVRHHVAIFIDGVMLASRTRLDQDMSSAKEIHVSAKPGHVRRVHAAHPS